MDPPLLVDDCYAGSLAGSDRLGPSATRRRSAADAAYSCCPQLDDCHEDFERLHKCTLVIATSVLKYETRIMIYP